MRKEIRREPDWRHHRYSGRRFRELLGIGCRRSVVRVSLAGGRVEVTMSAQGRERPVYLLTEDEYRQKLGIPEGEAILITFTGLFGGLDVMTYVREKAGS